MKRNWLMMCAMVAVLTTVTSSSAVALADSEYPNSGTQLPPMPSWWPVWFPFEEPPTPVPPVPSPVEILEAQIEQLERLQQQIDDLDAEIALLKLLLSLDPNGTNAPMLQMQIDMLEMQKAMLEAEKARIRREIDAG